MNKRSGPVGHRRINHLPIIPPKFDINKLNGYNWFMDISPSKNTLNSFELVKFLADHQFRLFSSQDVKELLEAEDIRIHNLKNTLHFLKSKGWIHLIRQNLYALDAAFLDREPIHEFESGTRLVQPSIISHFTAFHIHELTDQIPLKIYASSPTKTNLPGKRFTYKGTSYRYVQIKKEHFFGFKHIWRGSTKVPITDLERTLLDGLIKPKYCGGMREVIHGFTVKKFDVKKIVEYALRLDASVAKRLGWVLEKTGYKGKLLKKLEAVPRKGFVKLNPSGENTGPYNKRWNIRENI